MPTLTRISILYVILGVLIVVSVVPPLFYGTLVASRNRERLERNEKLLQNTITRSLGEDIAQRHTGLLTMLSNLSSAIQVTSGGDIEPEPKVTSPELRALLERFVSSSEDIAYATLLNTQARGISAGRITPDDFMRRELEHAFTAAKEGRSYTGQTLATGSGKETSTMMLVSTPVMVNGRFIGMVGAIVNLRYLLQRLRDASTGGLSAYVVDRRGRLVASADPKYATGRDMTQFEIVKTFVEQGARLRLAETRPFTIRENDETLDMLGTYSPVPALEWAVIAQKPQEEAYREAREMQRTALGLAVVFVLVSVLISTYAARRITFPLQTLTESSRAIARGDFSQRVRLKSRTEIGELAETFNIMTGDLERLVADLKRAAEENRTLFLSSIQMLAGAVDEKDPYTKGHSDRVTRYSVILATEMKLPQEEIEKIRIAALLHDVGKIGIEDRILKKPGALTPEEFEIMKTHTTKGATILRPVEMLKDMIPGIELHHESLDGRGYPYGLKGDQLPLLPRVITVADTFDAMTTNRPYQAAMETGYVVRIINSLANTKFDPRVVAALTSVFERGALRLHRAATISAEQAAAAGVGTTTDRELGQAFLG
ncbi:MAG TPA: HD domain-containing phosphohydrolase [Terriglobales bacterium]|nr:HD domain-containing phosphohydrolase [Terriglobales bacterium]